MVALAADWSILCPAAGIWSRAGVSLLAHPRMTTICGALLLCFALASNDPSLVLTTFTDTDTGIGALAIGGSLYAVQIAASRHAVSYIVASAAFGPPYISLTWIFTVRRSGTLAGHTAPTIALWALVAGASERAVLVSLALSLTDRFAGASTIGGPRKCVVVTAARGTDPRVHPTEATILEIRAARTFLLRCLARALTHSFGEAFLCWWSAQRGPQEFVVERLVVDLGVACIVGLVEGAHVDLK